MWCFIGTTSGGRDAKSRGIYRCRFDSQAGTLTQPELAAEIEAPSFLALHPNGKVLYSTRESRGPMGAAAFAIDRDSGKLSPLGEQSSGGTGACFVDVDATGRVLLVANYGSGSLAALPINDDGSLRAPTAIIQDHGQGPFPGRQEGPHAHCFQVDPSNRFALGCDLGTDHVEVFQFDSARAALTPNEPPRAVVPAGSGPRHLAFYPNRRFVYVVNELSSTINVFGWDQARGAMEALQTISTLPPDWKGESWAAEVCVGPGGEFLYASNRGHDSIAVFRIDPAAGTLGAPAHVSTAGHWPRHFQLDPTGRWLIAANERSDNLVVFRLDPATGLPHPTGHQATAPSPSCVLFLP